MTLTPRIRNAIRHIVPFGLIWLFFSWVFLFVEAAATNRFEYAPAGSIRPNLEVLIFASLAVFGIGLLIGTLEHLLFYKLFAGRSLGLKLLLKFLTYLLLFTGVIVLVFPIAASIETGQPVLEQDIWDRLTEFMGNIVFLSTLLQMGVSLLASLFFSEFSKQLGRGVLMGLLSGKYHEPNEEQRIFMFVDMNASTQIAEQLGHSTYFLLLKQYYHDVSQAIINHEGEVYQYVGDEIVITWKMKTGLRNLNCLRCFFAMREELLKRESEYIEEFGVHPAFKAGLHCGVVTSGAIGVIKEDIVYTGDVLNATSRILSLCETLDSDFLISEAVYNQLTPGPELVFTSKGKTTLRGKQQTLELYAVNRQPVAALASTKV
ncbi:adenylate/guanylate cyclase domain-containing protein [Croceiramulus getboli]|nr:adenylate/guanylate cyclase domain-containing protein [Flavobacteriaceae bacterium YJPT1-3]